MEEEIIFKLLANVGVPTAVCFYTLVKIHPAIKDLTNAINKLGTDVERRELEQSQKIDQLERQVHALAFKVENLQRKE